jgi:hypothetical protein
MSEQSLSELLTDENLSALSPHQRERLFLALLQRVSEDDRRTAVLAMLTQGGAA